MHRPFWLPVPAFALHAVLGGMSAVVLESQRVLPKRLLGMGFQFRYPELKAALESIF
jgi:NAD dependent epimerase/dehydratase family enzyme